MGGNKGLCSSYNVFMSFVSETGDASGILSADCYNKWVSTRKSKLKQPEESFRRVLTAHVCGLIGRKPFPADIEASLLRSLRKKQVWPCFRNTEVTIGIKGFRKTGFHESRRGIFGSNALSSTLSPKNKPLLGTGCVTPNPNLVSPPSRRESHSSTQSLNHHKDLRVQAQLERSEAHRASHSPLMDYPQLEERRHRLEKDVAFTRAGSEACEVPENVNEGLTMKRSYDSLDPLHIFNNSSPALNGLQANLQGFVPFAKRLKPDKEQIPLNSNLYPWKGVNSNFLLTGFQDIHVPTTPTACTNQNWPLA